MNNKFFTLETESRKQFFQVPKQFMNKKSKYYKMTSDSKLLYGILADRNSLSIQNKWIDEENRIYFIATVESLIDLTGWAKQKVIEKLKELRKFDLLISKQKGQGNPSWHYLLQIDVEAGLESQSYQQKYENHTSRSVKIKLQEVPKSYSNNTNINNTNINNTDNLSIQEDREGLIDSDTAEGRISLISKQQGLYISKDEARSLLYLADERTIISNIIKAKATGNYIANPFYYILTMITNKDNVQAVQSVPETTSTEDKNIGGFNSSDLERRLLGWD